MKNYFNNLFSRVKEHSFPTVNRRSTDGQSQRQYSIGVWKYVAMMALLLTLVCGQAWGATNVTPTGTLNISNVTSSNWGTWTSGTPVIDANGFHISSPMGRQSTSNQNWVGIVDGSTGSYTWSAGTNAHSLGKSAYDNNNNNVNVIKLRSTRKMYFRVTGCTAAYALVLATASYSSTISAYEYTSSRAGSASKTASTNSTTATEISVTELDPTKTYEIELFGSDNSDGCLFYEICFVPGAASSPRTFKSGQKVFFKDASQNISWGDLNCLWKVSSGNVYAYFWNDTENAWSSAATKVYGTENQASAVYSITVPGSGKEYTKVLFSRGKAANFTFNDDNCWQITTDQQPAGGKNMFCVTYNDGDYDSNRNPTHKWVGTWETFANGAAIVGDMNDWIPDGGEFNYSGSIGTVYMDLEASTNYSFKVLDGTGWKGNSGTITNTTSPWWTFNTDANCTITTAEAGSYAFKWNNGEDTKYLGVFYPRARLTKNKYIYFDGRNESDWDDAAYHAKFLFKRYDSDDQVGDLVFSESPLEDWVYYAVVPDNDYVGQVQIMRMNPNNHNDQYNYANISHASTRTSPAPNCLVPPASGWSGIDLTWGTYCPPMTTPTLSDNSTTTYGGSGTEGSPYLVEVGTSINVQATGSSSSVPDPDMTAMYDFKVGGSTEQNTTSTTFTYTASTTHNTTHTLTVDAYNTYNETNSTKNTSSALYYKAVTIYDIAYKKGANGTGTEYTDKKIKGTNITLRGAIFTRTGYTQTGWATSDGGAKVHNLSATYSTDAALTLYPVWTAKTTAITLDKNGGDTDGSVTATYDSKDVSSLVHATRTGYTQNGYETSDHTLILKSDGKFDGTHAGYTDSKTWVNESANVTLYARWEAIEYTLSYTLNGGSVASDNPTNYTIESSDITLNNPTKTGYTFAGWTGTGLAEATTTVTIAAGSTGDRSYTATWTCVDFSPERGGTPDGTYTVGEDGGTLTCSVAAAGDYTYQWKQYTSGQTPAVAVDAVGTGASSTSFTPHPTVAGTYYYFCEVTNSCSVKKTTSTSGTFVFNAAATLYTVTYNVNGGGSVTPTSATQASAGAAITLATPTWSGYRFEGWYNAGTKIGDADDEYTPTADITLYAHWTDNISGKVFSYIDGLYGDKYKAFDASTWVTSDGSDVDKTYTNATTGVQFIVDNGYWDNKTSETAKAISSLAKFKNGTTSMSVVIPTGKIATVKIGYGAFHDTKKNKDNGPLTIGGVSQTEISTALKNELTNAEVDAALKEVTLNSQQGTLTFGSGLGNIYIGRVSAVITGYTVSYAAGTYGSGSLDSGTKTAGSAFTLSSSSSAFTRDGYTYDGWSTNADGSTKDYNLGGSYTTDAVITLYPHWVTEASVSATLLTDTYVRTGSTDVQLSVSVSGASSGWYYRIKNTNTAGYQTPDNTTYTTTTWTMTSTVGAGANPFVVELYNGSNVKMAESSTITVYGETGHPMTILAGANGTVSPSGTIYANGDHLHPEITATPSSGYHFVNWTLSNENATLDDATSATTTITNATGACTITAIFAVDGYTVTYADGGATGDVPVDASSPYEEGDEVTILGKGSLAKTGYSFGGWSANVDLTIDAAVVTAGTPIAADKEFAMPAEDVTLTAVWTPNTYDITYNLNGASWASDEGVAEYTYGTGATLPVDGDMTNTGYTFGGWKDNRGLTGSSVTTIGTSEYGNKEYWAKWTENTYTITYNANGDGAGNVGDATGSTSDTEGHYVTVADNGFALEDHVFAGWNTASDGGGDSYGEGDEIELTADMTLYAIWATDYTISWGNVQIGGAGDAVTPNLGGGNYTITASVATWTGTLTTDMISAVSDGVTITNVAVDNSAFPKTITATFNVGASVAGTTIKMQLDVPAYGVYGAKSSEESITIDRCSGGVDASTVVFSQNFSSVGAGSVDYAANTAREYKSGGTTIAGIVGSGTNEFTYIGQAKKDKCGVAVNSSTGGNSVNATGMFQAYCNNTGGMYALVKNSNFAATAPTALKVSMKIWFQNGSSGSDYSVTFAVGDGFSNSTSAPDATNVHSGFSIINNSNAYLYAYKSNKTALSGTNKLTQGSDLTMVWVINNSGQTLSYTDPASNTSTLANDKFDVWIGTTRFIAGANATTASKALQDLYIGDPAGKNHQLRLDDIVVTDISPAVSSITPTLTWDDGALDIASDGVTKEEGAADFTFTASQNKNSLGAITYSSSNTSVATVNASGKVHIVGNGSTTITASIAESGCYKDADVSYSLTVNEKECADAAGTIKDNDGNTIAGNAITKSSCETVTLKLVGYTDGADIQWYKDGEAIDGATNASYSVPTSGSGVYSAISSKTCDRNSTNEITITNSASVSATKIVDSWYVKAGRRTPDIALVQTTDAASFQVKISSTVIWSTVSGSEVTTGLGGCGFYLGKDGIIYLKGTKNNGNATDDLEENKTLSFVVTNACGTNASDPGNITIKRQAATDRPSVAYVSLGAKDGAVTDTTAGYYKTAALYKYLDHTLSDGDFDLTARNVYWSVNEKELKEHYSQFDAILITDDPSTKTVPSGVSGDGAYKTKGYVNALGCLVDIRPILTMEAYVSALANWKAKGINGDPTSPNPRQYSMKLQCKDHEIFGTLSVGDNVVQTTVDGTNYWSVKMVDNTKSPYSGLADDEKTSGKGSIPALQGFAASDVSGLLLLGQISDGAYHAGVERQEEPAARLMLLGLNNQALPNALTQEGKIVIKNALTYLLKTNMEEVDDCSNYFTGATSTDWNTPSNWFKGVVPNSPMIRARILAPCEITGITVKAAQIDIVTSGTSSKKAGELTGKLTINPTGALIVGGKIRAAEAPYFSIEDLKPTEEEDLVLNTNSSNQAALVFNNEDGDTKATVNLYSLGRKDGNYQYQYFAVPMEVVPVNPAFANETHGGTGIYTYVYDEASSGWTRRKYYDDLFAFEGLGITTKSTGAMTYTMTGNLASTATKEITLTNDGAGLNLIGNSWMAPIQIGALAEDNTDDNITQTVYIYCAGRDAEGGAQEGDAATETAGQWIPIPFEASGTVGWRDAGKLSVIPAMQAFQIKVDAEATLTLDYDKVVRGSTNDLNAKLRAPGRRMAANEVTMTNIRVADSKTHTDLSLFEGDRFSEAFDNGWEAEYMNGDGRSAKLYAETEAGQMAVAAMYDYEGTVVGFVPGQETEYTFSFMGEDNGYYLNDIKLQNSVRISEGETYTFTYEEGDAANRFYISRTPIDAPQTSTGVDNTGSGEVKARKFIYRDKMYILINGRVYSADGALVK